jgi:hypothetical protein
MALALATGLSAADFAYVATSTGQFGTINLNSGEYTQITSGAALAGLGVLQGALYGGEVYGGTLYQVNPSSGSLTAVGDSGIEYWDFGSTIKGLYAIDENANLYSVNATTAAATLIGQIAAGRPNSLSTNSETLYCTIAGDFYTLDITTAVATMVGNTGTTKVNSLVFEGGELWAGVATPFEIDTINTSTGVGTFVSNPTGNPEPADIYGLAPSILLSVSPARLTFPREAIGSTSSPENVTLTNNGFVAMVIKGIETSGAFSESSTTCGSTLAPKTNCTIGVTFTPTESGKQTGSLKIKDNAGGSPQVVALVGTGK